MKKVIFLTFSLFLLLVSSVFAQKPEGIIKKASVAPVIDGVVDEVWTEANVYNIDKNFQAELATLGASGETTWKALWTNEGTYILLTVTDDAYYPNYAVVPWGNSWEYDKPEIYFDVNNVLADGLGGKIPGNQGHYLISPDITAAKESGALQTDFGGVVKYAFKVNAPNYVAEYFISFSFLKDKEGFILDLTGQIGFDVTIIDRDPDDAARNRFVWANVGAIDESWVNMDDAGIVMFEGAEPTIFIENISLTGGTITQDNGTLQIVADILPLNATFKGLNWTVTIPAGSNGMARISSSGVLTAIKDGVVNVSAKADDGSNVEASVEVTISGQVPTFSELSYIVNGNFDNNTSGVPDSWDFWSTNGGIPPIVTDGVVICDPVASSIFWDYQLMQNIDALPNTAYTFSFTAWADANRSIIVNFDDPANGYRVTSTSFGYKEVNLTTVPTTFTFNVVFDQIVQNTIQRMVFNLSTTSDVVYIDNVSLLSNDDYALLFSVDPSEVAVSPDTLYTDLFTGEKLTQQFTINNNADNSFAYTISVQSKTNAVINKVITLDDVKSSLDESFSEITDLIPNKYLFSDGESGNSINDGGNDMYDIANLLSTNLGGSLAYTQGAIQSTSLLNGSSYFTMKYPGLFIFAGDINNVNSFTISGNNGADGTGNTDGVVLTIEKNGKSYIGFVKRVYNAGDPSINHLIVVENNGLATHQFNTNTDIDFHQVDNLSTSSRIYYLLYAGANGLYINDESTLAIMNSFLDAIGTGGSWLTVSEDVGTIPPGTAKTIDVLYNSDGLEGGLYEANIVIKNRYSVNSEIDSIPASLTVTGAPVIASFPKQINFGQVWARETVNKNISIQNVGSETLSVTGITVDSEKYTINNTPFDLLPGKNVNLNLAFYSNVAGNFPANLTITSNDQKQTEYVIPLTAEALFTACNPADSLALVAIYNATNGPNWNRKDNWLTDEVQKWYGIKLNNEGRVIEINLVGNRLNGYLPAETGNLTGLQKLQLGNNMFNVTNGSSNNLNQQTLPQSLVNLTNLQILSLDQLNMYSELPDIFGGMTVLRELYIQGCYFTNNSLPTGITLCNSLEIMNISYNNFYNLPDLSGLNNLIQLNAYGCYFDFADIEPNLGIPNFSYGYQRLVPGNPESLNPVAGETIIRTIEIGGENNLYQWLKDGQALPGQTTNTLTLENVSSQDAGIYTLRVTNSLATQLVLRSQPLILYQNQLPVYSALIALYNSAGGDNWNNNTNWLSNKPITSWYGIYQQDDGTFYLSLYNNNLVGSLPQEFGDLSIFYNIVLSNNQGLTGAIPSSIGQLTKLQNLYLQNNNHTGDIPAEIVNCANLRYLNLYNNQIVNVPALTGMSNLNYFNVYNNKLEFDDIIPNIGNISNFNYAPQKKYGEVEAKPLVIGGSVTFNGIAGGAGNVYQWYKNDVLIQGQTGSELVFASLTAADEGTYACQVTNPAAPNLTLVSEPKSLFDVSNQDAYEPDNYFARAKEITGSDYQQRSLFPAGDRDIAWFEVIQAPAQVRIWFSNGVWGSRQMAVYATDTTTVLAAVGNSYVTFTAKASGIYYVKTWSQNSEVIPEYFLDIEITPFTVDQYEPDNTWADAKQITPFFAQTDHNLKPLGDMDYVKFEITDAPRTVTVEAYNETNCKYFSLWLYDTDGNSQLNYSETGAKNCGARLQFSIQTNGTYYVKTKVPSWRGQEMYDDYTISVVTDGQPPVVACNAQDSLALVSIYNATNGPNWNRKDNWLTGNVLTWYGVTMNIDGRVTGLNLVRNRLQGYLPAETGNLTELQKLQLGNQMFNVTNGSSNNLNQQPLPQTMANLTKLQVLSLDQIYMWNELPDMFGGMTALRELYLQNSYFTNHSFPESIKSCSNLGSISIYYNNFYDLPDLSGLNKLTYLNAYGCYFSFDDIEPNLGIPNFSYYGQRLILGTPESLNPVAGETISRTIEVGGTYNIYQWYKDGQAISGHNTNTLILENISAADAGIYTLRVTNSAATQLTLSSHPIILYQSQLPIYQALKAFYNSTGGSNWNNNTNWLSNQPITTWYGINVNNSNGLIYLNLYNNNLVGTLPQEFGDLSIFYQIQIRNNPGLTGEIPASVGQLTNLQYLSLNDNKLTGTVPASIGQLNKLRQLNLQNCNLTGTVPSEIVNCSSLQYFYFYNNQISGLPSDLTGMNLYGVEAYNNKLEFDDILPWIGKIRDWFNYSPQKKYGEIVSKPLVIGGSVTFNGTAGGAGNVYQWYKNDVLIQGQTGSELVFASLTAADEGTYACKVTNPSAPNLTLVSEPKSLYDASDLDAYEPDNYFKHAQEITVSDYQQRSLFPAGERDIAWFEITQPSQVKVWFSNGVWGSRQMAVYATDTTTVLAAVGNSYVTFTAQASGIYYVKTWSQNSEVIPEYFLDIEITPFVIDQYEPDNTWADAKQITPFFAQDDHNLKPLGDQDYVKFEITDAPRTVTVEAYNETNCKNFSLWLFDIDGVSQLSYSETGAKNCGARLQFSIQTNGTYYVKTKVPSWRGQEMYDDYTISVVTDGQPPVIACNAQDSLALVAIYNATNGPNWSRKDNWLTGNVQTWYGVTMNIKGRVTGLNLARNGLNGYLPSEVGNLTEMKKLHLGNYSFYTQSNGSNNLGQQTLPQSLANLSKLELFSLDGLYLNNELPDVFGGMTALRELYIQECYFTNNSFPMGITLCNSLERMNISYNNFYNLPDLSGLNKLTYLNAYGCYFSFKDIEPNLGISNFNYGYQRLILGIPESLNPSVDETISRTIEVGGTYNIYQWLKDGQELAGQTTNTLTLENVSIQDAGIYTLRVTNSKATQLTLNSHPFILYQNQLPIYHALEALYNSTGGNNWNRKNNWLSNQPITTWEGVNLNTWNGLYYLSLYDNNLVGTLPQEFGELSIFYQIDISDNPGLTGAIPSSIGQLTNLQNLYLRNNALTGDIPVEIGNMTNLYYFDINGNQIGSIPDEIVNCSNLRYFLFNNNKIAGLPNLAGMDYLYRVYAQNNNLEFDDINPMVGQIDDLNYAPQDSIGESLVITKTVGENMSYTLVTGGEQNQYQWFKDGGLLAGKTSATLEINNLAFGDSGKYYCEVTNTQVPGLTLTSRIITLEVKNPVGSITIDFHTGWNIFSSTVMPDDSNLKNILQSLIDAGKLKKVMNEKGEVIEDWGYFGGWQNSIGNLQNTEGYKINVTSPSTIEVTGIRAQFPFDIPLNAGWNIISWPSPNEQNGKDVFQTLINEGKLKKVMEESGKVIEDWGYFGGWQNTIGNLKPGEGYKVNVTAACTLTINETGTKSEEIIPELIASTHFIPAYKGNGTDHMNINLVNLSESGIIEGDEIGIFDGDICVGSAQINIQHSTFNIQPTIAIGASISIPTSAADGIEGKNGYSERNAITLKLFRNGNEYPLTIQPLNQSKTVFEKGGSLFAQVDLATGLEGIAGSNTTQINCFPNPFSDEVTFEINLATDAQVQVEVLNQLGQRVKMITPKQQLISGVHRLTWNGQNTGNGQVAPGVYHVRIEIDDSVIHRKIVLSK